MPTNNSPTNQDAKTDQLANIVQRFFDQSTGGAYYVVIKDTREYAELKKALLTLIANEVIGRNESIDHAGNTAQFNSISGQNMLRKAQRTGLNNLFNSKGE